MRRVVLANETDWEGWRKATRSLVLAGVAPEDVRWSVRSHDEDGDPLPEATGSFWVPRVAGPSRVAGDPGARCVALRTAVSPGAGAPTPESRPDDDDDAARPAPGFRGRAEAHRMRTCCAFCRCGGGGPRYLGWYRAGAFRAGGECPTDRAAISQPDVSDPHALRRRALGGQELRFSHGAAPDAVADDAALQSWWAEHSGQLLRQSPRGNRHPRGGGP